MDIDAVCVDMLTTEKIEKSSKEGRCFKCKKQGHISRKCLKEKKKEMHHTMGTKG